MNDETREKLSAYLDGALPDAERRAVELELSSSAEMRTELEALRAVSKSIKDLPREPLPGGFRARLDARRARETEPARDWVLLPPAYRPIAAAMSMAIVAFVVWDKAHGPSELAPKTTWDGTNDRVAVKTAAEVPTSMDLSGRVASESAEPLELKTAAAKKDEAADKLAVAPPGRRAAAPGKPIGILEESPAYAGAKAGGGNAAPAAPPAAAAPAATQTAAVEGADGKVASSFLARSEEERSAINERLYKNFEDEKKKMGIARIIEKDADERSRADSGNDDVMTLQATRGAVGLGGPAAGSASARGALKGKTQAKKKSTPAVMVKAIALKTPEALQAAWVGAGLPEQPPSVDFPKEMAVFLVCPGNCAIVSVENRKRFLVVLYKDSDDYAARVKAVPMTSKPVVVKPAE